ncbi:MAG: hypothetical protein K9G39_03325 [Chlorobium sp.]|uniref:hypothetical protein n=1 Tax=Chlorobium sp. TaxID=1095 RepID=UPI0025C45027|nr:hypothetical protein [Chlorobium sp.]MCF8382615.1 hypothetical protein [Chlorobium sp.]
MKKTILAIGILLLLPFTLSATPFPKTSYDVLGKRNMQPQPSAALFVLIDQSISYDDAIKTKALELVSNWIAAGRAVEVYSFSSALPGRYTTRITGGRFDDAPSDAFIDNLKRSERERFTLMHSRQSVIARKAVLSSMMEAFRGSKNGIYHTDIVRTLKEISNYIRSYPAGTKNILLVSDMMENSSMTSFYHKGKARLLYPEKELQKVATKQMTGNFGGKTRVYILGLGFYNTGTAQTQSERYLDSDRINSIAAFWRGYFARSGAVVIETGKPMMFGTIR